MIKTRRMLAIGKRRPVAASRPSGLARRDAAEPTPAQPAPATAAPAVPAPAAAHAAHPLQDWQPPRPRPLPAMPPAAALVPGKTLRLALVDDDIDQTRALACLLRNAGHHVASFARPRLFQQQARRDTFDMVLLDWMMPEMTGLELLAWLRATRSPPVPVLMITARLDPADIVAALEAGADDYLVKPVAGPILLARIKALARRTVFKPADATTLSVRHITLDPVTTRAFVAGNEVELSTKDHQLAMMLLTNIARPLSRAYLLDAIWGKGPDVPTRTLDVHVSRLRTKLNLRPDAGFLLTTIYGFGYRLEVLDDAHAAPSHPALDNEAP